MTKFFLDINSFLKFNILLCVMLLIACDDVNTRGEKGDPKSKEVLQFKESLSKWNSSKVNKNYSYSISTSSWSGFGSNTTIYVKAAEVVKREYQSWNSSPKDSVQWSETNNSELGSHSEGAGLKTLDQLYDECRLILEEKNNAQHKLYFSTDNSGFLKQCFYVPNNCADDCNFGIEIQNLTFQ